MTINDFIQSAIITRYVYEHWDLGRRDFPRQVYSVQIIEASWFMIEITQQYGMN